MRKAIEVGYLKIENIEIGDHLLLDAEFNLDSISDEVKITAEILLITHTGKSDAILLKVSSDILVKEFHDQIMAAYAKEEHRIKWTDYQPREDDNE